MQHSRLARLAEVRVARRERATRAVLLMALMVIPVAAAMLVSRAIGPADGTARASLAGASGATAATRTVQGGASGARIQGGSLAAPEYLAYNAASASEDTTLVEVPDVVGRRLSDAVAVLKAAGLLADTAGSPSGSGEVADQQPGAGQIVESGTLVRVTLSPSASNSTQVATVKQPVVCIDPGHQSRSNSSKEPIAPGASQQKAKMSGGVTGIVTEVPEFEVVLQIAMNVQARLARSGVKVVMTRTTNDVDISNAERAQIANRARANLFLRIHASGNPDSRQAGVCTMYPAAEGSTKATSSASRRAALLTQQSVLSATGAPSGGVYARSDLAGFNWCTKPAILVECGFLSNRVEDRLLTSPAYQDKVAAGIARGVLSYLGR